MERFPEKVESGIEASSLKHPKQIDPARVASIQEVSVGPPRNIHRENSSTLYLNA